MRLLIIIIFTFFCKTSFGQTLIARGSKPIDITSNGYYIYYQKNNSNFYIYDLAANSLKDSIFCKDYEQIIKSKKFIVIITQAPNCVITIYSLESLKTKKVIELSQTMPFTKNLIAYKDFSISTDEKKLIFQSDESTLLNENYIIREEDQKVIILDLQDYTTTLIKKVNCKKIKLNYFTINDYLDTKSSFKSYKILDYHHIENKSEKYLLSEEFNYQPYYESSPSATVGDFYINYLDKIRLNFPLYLTQTSKNIFAIFDFTKNKFIYKEETKNIEMQAGCFSKNRNFLYSEFLKKDKKKSLFINQLYDIKRKKYIQLDTILNTDNTHSNSYKIQFSNSENYISTLSVSGLAKIWNIKSKANHKLLNQKFEAIEKIEFSPKNNYIVTYGHYDFDSIDRTLSNTKFTQMMNLHSRTFVLNTSLTFWMPLYKIKIWDFKSLNLICEFNSYSAKHCFSENDSLFAFEYNTDTIETGIYNDTSYHKIAKIFTCVVNLQSPQISKDTFEVNFLKSSNDNWAFEYRVKKDYNRLKFINNGRQLVYLNHRQEIDNILDLTKRQYVLDY